MADKNDDVIACLNKIRIHGIHVDEHPSIICPHEDNTQCIIADGIKMHLILNGSLTFLPIRRPTQDETKNANL